MPIVRIARPPKIDLAEWIDPIERAARTPRGKTAGPLAAGALLVAALAIFAGINAHGVAEFEGTQAASDLSVHRHHGAPVFVEARDAASESPSDEWASAQASPVGAAPARPAPASEPASPQALAGRLHTASGQSGRAHVPASNAAPGANHAVPHAARRRLVTSSATASLQARIPSR